MLDQLLPLLEKAGIPLSMESQGQMKRFHALLMEWNQRMDLTHVPEEQMALRHYGDSLLPLGREEWFPQAASLIDVGTGAGFPGMPLAIARQDLEVVLLDALKKRCGFLQAVVEDLGLKNVRVIHGRAEDAARSSLRQQVDIACARAVAPVNVLAEYLLPFVKVGGRVLMWKGPSLQKELAAAGQALQLLGGVPEVAHPLPISGYQFYVQPIKKQASTPEKYPRKAGTPVRNPL